MKTKLYISALLTMVLSLSACIKDDSTGASDSVSKISLSEPLQDTYTQNQWDVLKISPNVTQTNAQKELAYEWEVDYKVVSREKDLEYTCAEPGNYPARLKVTNGDEIKYYRFDIVVQYAYTRGLYVLGQHDGKSIISYFPEEGTGKSFSLDAFGLNNPSMDLTGEPKSLDITYDFNKNACIYVSLGSPSTVYMLAANRMQKLYEFKFDEEKYWVKRNPNEYPANEWFFGKNSIHTAQVNKPYVFELEHTYNGVLTASSPGTKVSLAKSMLAWKRPTGNILHGIAVFDNTEGHLLCTSADGTTRMPAELLAGTYIGHTLIGMGLVEEGRQLVFFTHKTSTGEIWYHNISPGYYPSSATLNIQPAVSKYSVAMTNNTVSTETVVASAPQKNIFYYSNGNKVYGHNVLSGINFPTDPLFTLNSTDETIVQMYVTEDESKLFVAANASSGDLPGSVYCYDINTNKLLWAKQNVTGKICSMSYRTK